jgi:alkylation response protein AidB-like acyl-CoA dehydrogenase
LTTESIVVRNSEVLQSIVALGGNRVVAVPKNLEEAMGAAHDVASSILASDAASVDREARWPERGVRALQEAGLGGLLVPTSLGGVGQGLQGLLRVCEALGAVCPSTSLSFGMHCVGSAVIAARATPQQEEDFLVPIAMGKHLTTLALSEPGTGAHFYYPQARIRGNGHDAYSIDGRKAFVTNGNHADSYVVSTTAQVEGTDTKSFSCVVVPSDAPGIEWGPDWAGMGMRGNSSLGMTLQDVRVPASNLLGSEGDQLWYVFNVISPYFLMAMAGTYLGLARSAFEDTTAHIKKRSYAHSGSSLSEAPVVQHRVGELFGLLERTRSFANTAAERADRGDPNAFAAVLTSKAEVADCAVRMVNECMTLLGGEGYGEDGRMHRHLRDVRAAHVMSPTTDLLRIWTGRTILDRPLLAE